jgi:nucleotide-binding universal stress UspA family protein
VPRFDRVLVPVDFSELTDTVLRYGVELTKENGLTIVFHVLEPLPLHFETAFGAFVNTEGLVRIRENALRLLEDTKAKYPGRNFVTELREGKPAPLIIDAAQRHRAQLIVMGTHGRGGIEHLFLGSVATRVIRNASCPVLTVRQPEPADAA